MNTGITQDELMQILDYNPDTGIFVWKVKPTRVIVIGTIAGCPDMQGYIRIGFRRKIYKAHRLAWLYIHGSFPIGEIDHINHDRSDNRIANLRVATRSENTQNTRCRKDNSTGLAGITFYKPSGKWRAQIRTGGKHTLLGAFDTKEQAHEAYMDAKMKLHPGYASARAIETAVRKQAGWE